MGSITFEDNAPVNQPEPLCFEILKDWPNEPQPYETICDVSIYFNFSNPGSIVDFSQYYESNDVGKVFYDTFVSGPVNIDTKKTRRRKLRNTFSRFRNFPYTRLR